MESTCEPDFDNSGERAYTWNCPFASACNAYEGLQTTIYDDPVGALPPPGLEEDDEAEPGWKRPSIGHSDVSRPSFSRATVQALRKIARRAGLSPPYRDQSAEMRLCSFGCAHHPPRTRSRQIVHPSGTSCRAETWEISPSGKRCDGPVLRRFAPAVSPLTICAFCMKAWRKDVFSGSWRGGVRKWRDAQSPPLRATKPIPTDNYTTKDHASRALLLATSRRRKPTLQAACGDYIIGRTPPIVLGLRDAGV